MYSENSADDASFNNHIISKFDSIFEEVFDYLPQVKRSFFLITLNSMREQMREYETTLVQLMQIDNPTFHELIREEQTRIYLDELHRTFEYVKVSSLQSSSLALVINNHYPNRHVYPKVDIYKAASDNQITSTCVDRTRFPLKVDGIYIFIG